VAVVQVAVIEMVAVLEQLRQASSCAFSKMWIEWKQAMNVAQFSAMEGNPPYPDRLPPTH